MKKTHSTKPFTSSLSTVSRKPLLNITNLVNIPQSTFGKQEKQMLTRPESTKSIKARISIDENSRPKLKQVYTRRTIRSQSQDSTGSQQQEKHCVNHKSRGAMHQIDSAGGEMLCLECSLVYAKQGYKIKTINHNQVHPQSQIISERSGRQKQTSSYLQKCGDVRNQLNNWRKQEKHGIKKVFEQFGEQINKQQLKMEQEIVKIRQIYSQHIKSLQNSRQEKIQRLKNVENEVETISQVLQNTIIDIQNNYDDCLKSFNSKQYRQIMDQYWKHIANAQIFLTSHPLSELIKQFQTDIKMTVRTMERTNNTIGQFTFSKEKKFQTPPFSKELRGIKIVQSQPDSNRYNSSLKQSVVDTNFHFSEFLI